MKILAFGDTHGSLSALKRLKEKAKNAELVVCAGDITIFEHEIIEIVKKLNSFKKQVLIIPGNHETEDILREVCKNNENVHYIHKSKYETEEAIFLGFGTGGFAVTDPEFEKTAKKKFKGVVKKNRGRKKVILVTHAPPYGTKVDIIMDNYVGNKSIRRFIEKYKVDLNICGHIHETCGKEDDIGETHVVNPGPNGMMIRI